MTKFKDRKDFEEKLVKAFFNDINRLRHTPNQNQSVSPLVKSILDILDSLNKNNTPGQRSVWSEKNELLAKQILSGMLKSSKEDTFRNHPTGGKSLFSLKTSHPGGEKAYNGYEEIKPSGVKIERSVEKGHPPLKSSETNLRRKTGLAHGVGDDVSMVKHVSLQDHDRMATGIDKWAQDPQNMEKLKNHEELKRKIPIILSEINDFRRGRAVGGLTGRGGERDLYEGNYGEHSDKQVNAHIIKRLSEL